jgi:hypothetical protein
MKTAIVAICGYRRIGTYSRLGGLIFSAVCMGTLLLSAAAAGAAAGSDYLSAEGRRQANGTQPPGSTSPSTSRLVRPVRRCRPPCW